jgi:hypothetical protein
LAAHTWATGRAPFAGSGWKGGRDVQTAQRVLVPPKLSRRTKVKPRNSQLDTNFLNFPPVLTLAGTDIWIRENNIVGKQRHIAVLKLCTITFGFDNQNFPSVHLGISNFQ